MLADAFYPRADTGFGYGQRDGSLPPRPQVLEPILDAASLVQPLTSFSEDIHKQSYASEVSEDGTSKAPPRPEGFSDRYLYPMLTRNERLRLTMLWYYTKGLHEDQEILQKMKQKVDLLKSIVGWDIAICGLIENDIFERLTTSGVPLARLPRRESPCSHTIQQPAGSVFFVPDMAQDWRFADSPHCGRNGIRSYAGAQLRTRVDNDGQDIALGSLCLASNTPGLALDASQMEMLLKFADMLTEDIVNGSRRKRARQQEQTDLLLQEAFAESFKSPTDAPVLKILREVFPQAHIDLLAVENGLIQLPNGGPSIEVPEVHVKSRTWEDHSLIDELLRTNNHQRLNATRPIRAIIGTIPGIRSNSALVVSTTDITCIYDDIDVRFVEGCAMILRSVGQERSLQEALKTRERFMRGITHQLRTPIHGILGSVDLLADEIAKTEIHDSVNGRVPEHLRMIQSSGRELMSTVNNVIKFNRWADLVSASKAATLGNLDTLESEILEELSDLLPEDQLNRILILFCNQLPSDVGQVHIDTILVKDVLQSLILNAVQNTVQGSVVITISMAPECSSIIFDVQDTGCGIALADQHRIFHAYEKGNAHGTGAGLGLTLASVITNALNGSVTLVSSVLGVGSHFRAEFRDPSFACSCTEKDARAGQESSLPSRFRILSSSETPSIFDERLAHVLEARGLVQTDDGANAFAVVPFTHLQDRYRELLREAEKSLITISLTPAGKDMSEYRESHPDVLFFSGPFTSKQLEGIFVAIKDAYALRAVSPTTEPIASPELSSCGTEARPEVLRYDSLAPEKLSSRLDSMTLGATSPNCLLVDDNHINLRIMRMYCETRKFPYITALDGLQAVDQYKAAATTAPINLILLDLQMPNCDGIEACKQIRAFEVQEGLLPAVIFIGKYMDRNHIGTSFLMSVTVTGQDSPSDRTKSFEAGADKFYVKPLALKSLDKGIAEVFADSAESGT